jgi:putative peptidoglycan lipid II flippase
MEFPTALLGVALGTVILPSLAQHHSDANHAEYSALLDWGLRLALLLALPSAVALWLLGVPLVATLYQYGHFSVDDVWQTRAALLGYAVGLPPQILIENLAPGFYARQVMRTPVKIAFVTVLVTQALAVLFAWPLRLGHAGLTLATSLGACLNATLLFVLLRRHGFYVAHGGWWSFLLRVFVAVAVLGAVLAWLVGPPQAWLHATLWTRVGRLALLVLVGAGVYFATLFLLGFRLSQFSRREVEIDPAGAPTEED